MCLAASNTKARKLLRRVYTIRALAQCSMEHCANARIHISIYGYRWHRRNVPSVVPPNALAHFLTSCARWSTGTERPWPHYVTERGGLR